MFINDFNTLNEKPGCNLTKEGRDCPVHGLGECPGYTHLMQEEDHTDTVELDIPLLIRILEYAREDAKDDVDLHNVTERLIALSKFGNKLSMNDYADIVNTVNEAIRRQTTESLRDDEYYVYQVTFDDGTTTKIQTSNDWFDAKSYYAKRGKNVVKAERVGGIQGGDYNPPKKVSTEPDNGFSRAQRAYDRQGAKGVDEGKEQKYRVTYDIYGNNKEKPLYTNTRTVTATSEEDAIATIRKLVGGRNHRVEQGVAEATRNISSKNKASGNEPFDYDKWASSAKKMRPTSVPLKGDDGKEVGKMLTGRQVPVKKTKGVKEAGPFSYGAKKPKKGSLKHQMAQQSKKYWDQQPVIEPKDHMVGTARVVKDVKEAESVLPPEAIEIITKIAQSPASPEHKKAAIDSIVAKYLKPSLNDDAKELNEDIEQYIEELERAGYGIKEEKQRLDPKCWKGYKKAGTKMKGGVRVNNCVPVKKK